MMKDAQFPVIAALLVFLAFAVNGCRSSRPGVDAETADTITHIGTYSSLHAGGYEGFHAVSNLVAYGDHGLGTFDGLDGEMIIYSGVLYRADASYTLAEAPVSNETPYAVVTWFSPDRVFDVEKMSERLFTRALDMRRKLPHVPQAIQVEGYFSRIVIRSVPAQEKPWRPLVDALRADARSVTLTNVNGVMVGYYYPDELSSLHPTGYHFHFVDLENSRGGHVLDFQIAKARIGIDHSPFLKVILPTNEVATAMDRPVDPSQLSR